MRDGGFYLAGYEVLAARLSGLGCCLMLCAACGQHPELGRVSGRVTLDQEPVENATVMFQPREGMASYGITDADGNYRLTLSGGGEGAVIGKHFVTVETYRITVDEGGHAAEQPETIPARYNAESTLAREVKAGEQVIDFDLLTP